MLLQSSTVSDTVNFSFAGGEVRAIAGSYLEFVERKILLHKAAHGGELARRDGFEAGNADKIFESTTVAAAAASLS